MPKGKRGPRPQVKSSTETKPVMKYACIHGGCDFIGDNFEDWNAHSVEVGHPEYHMKKVTPGNGSTDPTAEEIVGEENVVDVGSADEGESEEDDEREQMPAERQGYKCMQTGCTYQTSYLSEMEEHNNGTGHGNWVTDTLDPIQPELFSTKFVHRDIQVPLPEDVIQDKHAKLAAFYQEALDVREEKKKADDEFNAQLKTIDANMQAIARVLLMPFTYEKADCEWRILNDENARGLFRLDTGAMIEKQPLTEEDRAEELAKAASANAVEQPDEVTA